eukprot:5787555-Pyramimonas_sp.AAC.1
MRETLRENEYAGRSAHSFRYTFNGHRADASNAQSFERKVRVQEITSAYVSCAVPSGCEDTGLNAQC